MRCHPCGPASALCWQTKVSESVNSLRAQLPSKLFQPYASEHLCLGAGAALLEYIECGCIISAELIDASDREKKDIGQRIGRLCGSQDTRIDDNGLCSNIFGHCYLGYSCVAPPWLGTRSEASTKHPNCKHAIGVTFMQS